MRRSTPGGSLSGCGVAAIVLVAILIAAGGGEGLSREGDLGEQLAGILRKARTVTAILGGNAVIQHRNYQLRIPFQPDNGELP